MHVRGALQLCARGGRAACAAARGLRHPGEARAAPHAPGGACSWAAVVADCCRRCPCAPTPSSPPARDAPLCICCMQCCAKCWRAPTLHKGAAKGRVSAVQADAAGEGGGGRDGSTTPGAVLGPGQAPAAGPPLHRLAGPAADAGPPLVRAAAQLPFLLCGALPSDTLPKKCLEADPRCLSTGGAQAFLAASENHNL